VTAGRKANHKLLKHIGDRPTLVPCRNSIGTTAEELQQKARALAPVQNTRQSLDIADRGYLIETGRIVGEGSAAALRSDPAVQRAYLGAAEVHT
jgi:branched-chain amino acid transport system ATP-binding protein